MMSSDSSIYSLSLPASLTFFFKRTKQFHPPFPHFQSTCLPRFCVQLLEYSVVPKLGQPMHQPLLGSRDCVAVSIGPTSVQLCKS